MVIQAISLAQVPGAARRVLRARGPDTTRFLQGTSSADVRPLEEPDAAAAIPAALLNPKGQLVGELLLLPAGGAEAVDALVPASIAEDLRDRLSRYVVMDEVEIELAEDLEVAVAWGRGELPALPDGVRAVATEHPLPGMILLGPRAALDEVLAQVPPSSPADYERARLRAHCPAWGRELVPGRLPPEVGFAAAVSYDKGCYLGQEPLARVHARGQTSRVMVEVRADAAPAGDDPPPLLAADGAEVGRWTSWIEDATGVLGLAVVRRAVASPGTALATPDGLALRVGSGPLGDDPGAGTRESIRAARARLRGT